MRIFRFFLSCLLDLRLWMRTAPPKCRVLYARVSCANAQRANLRNSLRLAHCMLHFIVRMFNMRARAHNICRLQSPNQEVIELESLLKPTHNGHFYCYRLPEILQKSKRFFAAKENLFPQNALFRILRVERRYEHCWPQSTSRTHNDSRHPSI